jgi:hypothetical protein
MLAEVAVDGRACDRELAGRDGFEIPFKVLALADEVFQ